MGKEIDCLKRLLSISHVHTTSVYGIGNQPRDLHSPWHLKGVHQREDNAP